MRFCRFLLVRCLAGIALLFLCATRGTTQDWEKTALNKSSFLYKSLTALKKWKSSEVIRYAKAAYSLKNATTEEQWMGHVIAAQAFYREKKMDSALRELRQAKRLKARSQIPDTYWLVRNTRDLETMIQDANIPAKLTVAMASPQSLTEAQISPTNLKALMHEAQDTHTDALVLWQNGKPIVSAYTGDEIKPIELMSLTRSIASLAIMFLLDEGKIPSVDQPVGTYYRSWQSFPADAPSTVTRRARVTLRHIMDDTSGIALVRGDKAFDFYESCVAYALTRDVETEPGTVSAFNNIAVNLLAGIVRQVSGESIETYLRKKLFVPLGITHYDWIKDQADNPLIYVGLSLKADDLAKIGQLLLDDGIWKGKRLLNAEIIRQFTQTASNPKMPESGLLWWLIPHEIKFTLNEAVWADWLKAKVSSALMKKLEVYRGQSYTAHDWNIRLNPLFADAKYQLSQDGRAAWKHADRIASREIDAFNGNGYYGQPLLVIPSRRIVAVRQIRAVRHHSRKDSFTGFISSVLQFSQKSAPLSTKH